MKRPRADGEFRCNFTAHEKGQLDGASSESTGAQFSSTGKLN